MRLLLENSEENNCMDYCSMLRSGSSEQDKARFPSHSCHPWISYLILSDLFLLLLLPQECVDSPVKESMRGALAAAAEGHAIKHTVRWKQVLISFASNIPNPDMS